jgi:hypothetical protein
MPLHRQLLNKTVASRTFAKRHQDLGRRLIGFKAKALKANGTSD